MNHEYIGEMNRSLVTLCKSLNEKIKENGYSDVVENNKVHSRITIGSAHYFAEILCKNMGENDFKYIATVYDSNIIFDRLLLDVKDRYSLTEREFDILKCAMRGKNNTEISKTLFISVPTVKNTLPTFIRKWESRENIRC